jgi:hypothetical protein
MKSKGVYEALVTKPGLSVSLAGTYSTAGLSGGARGCHRLDIGRRPGSFQRGDRRRAHCSYEPGNQPVTRDDLGCRRLLPDPGIAGRKLQRERYGGGFPAVHHHECGREGERPVARRRIAGSRESATGGSGGRDRGAGGNSQHATGDGDRVGEDAGPAAERQELHRSAQPAGGRGANDGGDDRRRPPGIGHAGRGKRFRERPARDGQRLPGERRRCQRGPQHGHRIDSQPGFDRRIPADHQQLRRRIWQVQRRGDERYYQVRHQRIPRGRLRVSAQRRLDARNFFDPTKAELRRNQFGYRGRRAVPGRTTCSGSPITRAPARCRAPARGSCSCRR